MDISTRQQNDDDTKLFVGGLAQETNEKDITEYFAKFGKIENLDFKFTHNGKCRGFAFVVLKDIETLNKVLAQGHEIMGQEAIVERAFAKNRGQSSAHRGGFRDGFRGRGRIAASRGGFRSGFRGQNRGRGGFRGRGGRGGHVSVVQNFQL